MLFRFIGQLLYGFGPEANFLTNYHICTAYLYIKNRSINKEIKFFFISCPYLLSNSIEYPQEEEKEGDTYLI